MSLSQTLNQFAQNLGRYPPLRAKALLVMPKHVTTRNIPMNAVTELN